MIKRSFASLLAALYAAGLLAALGGCNTMEGAGRDIEQGGRKIKEEARERR